MKIIGKFKLILLTLVMVGVYFVYSSNYTEPSTASETTDLFATYNLTSDQVEAWVSEYGKEQAEQMIEAHVEEQIANGAELINGKEEWDTSILLEKQNEAKSLWERILSMWE